MVPRIGTEFAGYYIEALLGRGGMSVVYRAENRRLGIKVALKILSLELTEDEMFRERFVRESMTAASINHPNIITIFDVGSQEEILYIAMRFVDGPDLKVLFRQRGQLPPQSALSIVAQTASALDAAHARGLIHRDVKPANILIDPLGGTVYGEHVYLADFGLTKHTGSRSGLTQTGEFLGTIDYVAPEQIEGKDVDARSDIYSLGCVLYESLTGVVPFRKEAGAAVLWAHVREDPAPVSTLRREVTPEIDAVVARAMAKAPDDRHQSGRELIVDLVEAVASMGVTPTAGRAVNETAPIAEGRTIVSDGRINESDGAPSATARSSPASPQPSELPATLSSSASGPPADQSEAPAPRTPQAQALETVSRRSSASPTGRSGWFASPSKLLMGLIGLVIGLVSASAYFLALANNEDVQPPSSARGMSEMTVGELLTEHIPESIASTCKPADPATNVFIASRSCSGPDGIHVSYSFAHTGTGMQQYYDEVMQKAGVSEDQGDCAYASPGEGPWWLNGVLEHENDPSKVPNDIGREGRFFCYEDGGKSYIVWKDNATKVFSVASLAPSDRQTLFADWETALGPINPENLHGGNSMPMGG